jgi:hypothetical protein
MSRASPRIERNEFVAISLICAIGFSLLLAVLLTHEYSSEIWLEVRIIFIAPSAVRLMPRQA